MFDVLLAANHRFAMGLDLWLLTVYTPEMTGHEDVETLWGETGRHRQRMDELTKSAALWRCQASTGSSGTFLEGCIADKGLDQAITRATCNIYISRVISAFANVRRLHMHWDPGSYTGHSINLGMCLNVDTGCASPLPVQVMHLFFNILLILLYAKMPGVTVM